MSNSCSVFPLGVPLSQLIVRHHPNDSSHRTQTALTAFKVILKLFLQLNTPSDVHKRLFVLVVAISCLCLHQLTTSDTASVYCLQVCNICPIKISHANDKILFKSSRHAITVYFTYTKKCNQLFHSVNLIAATNSTTMLSGNTTPALRF